jgi:hypothetical protein
LFPLWALIIAVSVLCCAHPCREVLDSQFRPSKFPKAFTYALIYVTSTLTLPNAIFTFLAFPEEATKYGEHQVLCGGVLLALVAGVDRVRHTVR